MKLLNEEQLLDKKFRIKVIEDILSSANVARKAEARKRYECYKDNTVKFVLLKLQRELKNKDTLALMENRASNVSILKKVVNKLGRVYSDSTARSTGNQVSDQQVTELAKLMNMNQKMKKADRFTRLFKNCLLWLYPDVVADGLYRLCVKIFDPSQFDVLQSVNEPEEAAAIVLSDFIDDRIAIYGAGPQVTSLEATKYANRDSSVAMASNAVTMKKNQIFIFWSNKYHLTCDEKGDIVGLGTITPPDYLNPIGVIPGVTSAEDQDGKYWADGGQDLVDGSILVNTLLTDMFAIEFMQGWGQLVITGNHVPEEFVMGPHHALVLRYDSKKDEDKPEVSVVSANPPLDAWMRSIEQYVALLLSTNNLSPTTIAGKLDIQNAPSGLAMLIDQSESTDSIEDKQQDFYWIEMKEWKIISAWHNMFYDKKLLIKDFMSIGRLPEDMIVTPKFEHKKNEVITEQDRLNNLKLKRDLALVTQLDMIMQDNPGMTREEAEKKLAEIQKDKVVQAADAATNMLNNPNPPNPNPNVPPQFQKPPNGAAPGMNVPQ